MIRCTSSLMLACLLGFIEPSVMRVFNSEGSPSPRGNLGPGRSPTRSTLHKSLNFVTEREPDIISYKSRMSRSRRGRLPPCFVFAKLAALREFSLPHTKVANDFYEVG